MNHSIVNIDGRDSVVTVFHDGQVYSAVVDQHPNFDKIVTALSHNPKNTKVIDLFDLTVAVQRKLNKVSDRVSLGGSTVYFDGDPVNNTLTDQIVRFVNAGVNDWKPLVSFMEKVMDNPNENSREQLFMWLDNGDFTITPNGDFVGYKGVHMVDGVGYSTRSAPAKDRVTVNGESVSGVPVPNRPGDVVEMPRSVVDPNEDAHCSVGLHVGTYSYASTFTGGNVLEVHVNPRDVVSVTSDSNREKIRTCRYTVVDYIQARYNSPTLEDEYDDEDVLCPECEADYLCCDEDMCDSCADERDDEAFAAEQEQAALEAQKEQIDTRLNYLKQARYPKGHPKAGQFIPKG